MADVISVHAASALIHAGKGQLHGVVITCSSATAALATFYDHDEASGTKLLEVYVSSTKPVTIFFSNRFAPMFLIGLYIALAANLTATVWTRQL